MPDLDDEFELALHRFERAGHALPGDTGLYVPGLGLQKIEPDGEFYHPIDRGQLALLIPIYDGSTPCFACPVDYDFELIDIVAICPKEPTRCWRRTGLAEFLGEHLIQRAVTWGHPLRVHATPWLWLKARCNGVCPLSPDYAALRCVADLLFDDVAFAERVERQLKRPLPIPRIRVRNIAA